jgi:MerR family transcriptional regulator, light-induced transcriptional regulator
MAHAHMPSLLVCDNADAFLEACLAGDRRRAHLVAWTALKHGVPHLYQEVVEPAMRRLGDLWYANRITVADEHLATAVAESTIAALYPDLAWPAFGPKTFVACVEGERHQFGARIVADFLSSAGWDALFFGADLPLSSLVDRSAKVLPVFVALSITLPHFLSTAEQTIAALRAAVPGVHLLVGGRAVMQLADPATLGADAHAPTGMDAVQVAEGWKHG